MGMAHENEGKRPNPSKSNDLEPRVPSLVAPFSDIQQHSVDEPTDFGSDSLGNPRGNPEGCRPQLFLLLTFCKRHDPLPSKDGRPWGRKNPCESKTGPGTHQSSRPLRSLSLMTCKKHDTLIQSYWPGPVASWRKILH